MLFVAILARLKLVCLRGQSIVMSVGDSNLTGPSAVHLSIGGITAAAACAFTPFLDTVVITVIRSTLPKTKCTHYQATAPTAAACAYSRRHKNDRCFHPAQVPQQYKTNRMPSSPETARCTCTHSPRSILGQPNAADKQSPKKLRRGPSSFSASSARCIGLPQAPPLTEIVMPQPSSGCSDV